MRRALACGVLLGASAPVLLAVPAALAAEQQRSVGVDASAWSWRRVVPAGQPVGEPSNVPAGGLAVQFDGRPDAAPAKATYLHLALGDLPAGSVASGFTLVLPLDPANTGDATTAPLVACVLAKPFVTGDGVDPASEPTEDCTHGVPGVYDPVGKAVSFPLTNQVSLWLAGQPNNGLVVRPDPAAAVPTVAPFQLTFTGAKTVQGLLSFTAPTIGVNPPADDAPPPYVPSYVAGPALAPVPGFVPGPTAIQPPVPVAAPAVVVPVEAAPAQGAPVVLAPVVRSRATARASQAGLAAGTALGLGLLALVGWSLGDAANPRAFARAERRRKDRIARGAVVLPVDQAGLQIRQGRKPLSSAASTVT